MQEIAHFTFSPSVPKKKKYSIRPNLNVSYGFPYIFKPLQNILLHTVLFFYFLLLQIKVLIEYFKLV